MRSRHALTPHAVILGSIAVLVLAWGPLSMALPDLDALLAPGGASPGTLVASLLLILLRTVAVLVLPGVGGATLVDAMLVAMEREDGVAG